MSGAARVFHPYAHPQSYAQPSGRVPPPPPPPAHDRAEQAGRSLGWQDGSGWQDWSGWQGDWQGGYDRHPTELQQPADASTIQIRPSRAPERPTNIYDDDGAW